MASDHADLKGSSSHPAPELSSFPGVNTNLDDFPSSFHQDPVVIMGNPMSKRKEKTKSPASDMENSPPDPDDILGQIKLDSSNGVVQAPFTQTSLGQKRKTEEVAAGADDSQNISLHLYQLTLSKLLSSPPRRVEPPLQRSVVMRNTLKQLEFGIFSHSPSKRIYLDLDESTALNNLHLSPQTHSAAVSPPPVSSSTPHDLVDSKPFSDPVTTPHTASTFNNQNQISAPPSPPMAPAESFTFCNLLPVIPNSVSAAANSANQQQDSSQVDAAMDVTQSFFSSAQPCSAESLEKMKYAPLSDVEFQSLINSSMDQYSLCPEASQASRPPNQNHDELDSIMQVLVGM